MWRRLFALTIPLAVVAAASAVASSTTPEQGVQRNSEPPAWTRISTRCVVDLQDASHPSGVVGYIGYNVSRLAIIDRRHVPCPRAKRYARAEWVHGPSVGSLRWRYVRAWQSTAGSAYVGDFKGRHGKKLVEYLAVH